MTDSIPTSDAPVIVTETKSFARRKKEKPNREVPRALKRLAARQSGTKVKQQVPGWVSSLVAHTGVLLLLAFVTLPLSKPPELSLQAVRVVEESLSEDDELFDLNVDLEQDTLEETIEQEIVTDAQVEISTNALEVLDSAPLELVTAAVDFGTAISDIGDVVDVQGMSGSGLQGRGGGKAALLAAGGGTKSSEKAVAASLDWIARHQYPDGSWNFDHSQSECNGRCADAGTGYNRARAAATGLALLTYLGAGHTQEDGRYQRVVYRGLYALGNMFELDKNGASFREPEGRMYSHGIATMAICEAYAMTGDPALRDPAQAAINYTCYAQDPNGGGWRYAPQQAGDTSVMGWQLGALKSGYLSQLSVPPLVVQRASGFLDTVMTDGGKRYYYTIDGEPGHEACTAIGTLCRMYMGTERDAQGIPDAIDYLSRRGPSRGDVYYNYYTAQAIFHYTGGKGATWKKWNEKMRDQLVETQAQQGHETGSWAPVGEKNAHGVRAGRLFTTAMSAMTLEVYYRMMPIYRETAAGKFD